MAEYEKKVREVLRQNGFVFHHQEGNLHHFVVRLRVHGKGGHDVWSKSAVKVTVDGKIKSRHMANQIMEPQPNGEAVKVPLLQKAGVDHHF
jgi:hypothetical protein